MTFTYAKIKYVPIPRFDEWFARTEKDIMYGYGCYCRDLKRNVPLKPFCESLWHDYVFGYQHNMN